ncbi:MAG TPA: SAM-dependent methyltransferase [Parachlamydiaceae bacterium]|nr:SAM-dependent methyltransferase [Parachlamydiaceae bacterium]
MEEEALILNAIQKGEFVRAVFSTPLNKEKGFKIEIRPLLIKNQIHYQVTEYRGAQVFHKNYDEKEIQELIFSRFLSEFKQSLISLKNIEFQVLANKKGKRSYLKKSRLKENLSLLHNRKKNYLLDEVKAGSFLEALGLVSKEGSLIAKKSDKYRQLNRFLEMVADVLPFLKKNKKLHIVDFGCGKAYLTFALYYYLHVLKGYDVSIIGLDLKKDVVDFCEKLARQLKFEGLSFLVGDIAHYETKKNVNMVVSLHACDTATDAALAKAVSWQADVILSVPCCQHELFSQIQNEALMPLLKHGILKERFAALATDAARAQILEIEGYLVQILEFIDMEHTPKNLLIRAVKNKIQNKEKSAKVYQIFKKELNIALTLEKLLKLS